MELSWARCVSRVISSLVGFVVYGFSHACVIVVMYSRVLLLFCLSVRFRVALLSGTCVCFLLLWYYIVHWHPQNCHACLPHQCPQRHSIACEGARYSCKCQELGESPTLGRMCGYMWQYEYIVGAVIHRTSCVRGVCKLWECYGRYRKVILTDHQTLYVVLGALRVVLLAIVQGFHVKENLFMTLGYLSLVTNNALWVLWSYHFCLMPFDKKNTPRNLYWV